MNRKYIITPEIHERIKLIYKRDTGNGQVQALARRIGMPASKLYRYASEQGWPPKQKKNPIWSKAELEILESNAHLSMNVIRRKLKSKGYHRTVVGIACKRKEMRLAKNLKGQSASKIGFCLGVDKRFVIRAIKAGQLKARRRGTERTPQQGGDEWFIREKHVREYIIENIHEIDIRKVDKYWFVDILVNNQAYQ